MTSKLVTEEYPAWALCMYNMLVFTRLPCSHFAGIIRCFSPKEDNKRGFRIRNGEGNGTPLQYSCLENPRDGGAWWAAIYGVTQSCT